MRPSVALTALEREAVQGFFRQERHCEQLISILLELDFEHHYAVYVDGQEALDELDVLYHRLLAEPVTMLPALEEELRRLAHDLLMTHVERERMTSKPFLHLRLAPLGPGYGILRRVPQADSIGKLVEFSGTVIRIGMVKMLEYEREFICDECKHVFTVQADFEQFYIIPKPVSCPNPGIAGADLCESTKFTCLNDPTAPPKSCRDFQEVKIQEQIQHLEVGTIPRSIMAVLEMDLADACKAGDDVNIVGVVRRRWRNLKADQRCDIETVFHANSIVINNGQDTAVHVTDELREEFRLHWQTYVDRPISGRNVIIGSFCPQIFGLYVVKLAVMMVIVGGVPRMDASGTRTRGESHMLLVGDPGTGKSQFLKYAAKLVPRSVITTGIGSTSAGLTVTAVRDGGEWTLEAGALVLADGGLCCIDEFSGIREHDRGSIHEAMEQQTLSVAKAGLVCKLNTRTTILAATNPKGSYDPEESISVNVAVASPLLSRFDIIMVLIDTKNAEWDRTVSGFILGQRAATGWSAPAAKNTGSATGLAAEARNSQGAAAGAAGAAPPAPEKWPMSRLKAYISYVQSLRPSISTDAEMVLSRYYQTQRLSDGRSVARTTIRLLESMVRLAQAHAKLMCRGEATLTDAVVAVTIMEASMQSSALLGATSPLHSAFPEDAEAEYDRQESIVLERLGLLHLRRPRRENDGVGGGRGAAAAAPADTHTHGDEAARNSHTGRDAHGAAAGPATAAAAEEDVEQPGHAGHVLLSQRPHHPRARVRPGQPWAADADEAPPSARATAARSRQRASTTSGAASAARQSSGSASSGRMSHKSAEHVLSSDSDSDDLQSPDDAREGTVPLSQLSAASVARRARHTHLRDGLQDSPGAAARSATAVTGASTLATNGLDLGLSCATGAVATAMATATAAAAPRPLPAAATLHPDVGLSPAAVQDVPLAFAKPVQPAQERLPLQPSLQAPRARGGTESGGASQASSAHSAGAGDDPLAAFAFGGSGMSSARSERLKRKAAGISSPVGGKGAAPHRTVAASNTSAVSAAAARPLLNDVTNCGVAAATAAQPVGGSNSIACAAPASTTLGVAAAQADEDDELDAGDELDIGDDDLDAAADLGNHAAAAMHPAGISNKSSALPAADDDDELEADETLLFDSPQGRKWASPPVARTSGNGGVQSDQDLLASLLAGGSPAPRTAPRRRNKTFVD